MIEELIKLALCFIGAVSSLNIVERNDEDGVKKVQTYIEHARTDLNVQKKGCLELQQIAQIGREHEADGPFNRGKFTPTKYLNEGIGEAFAQGLLNIMRNPNESEEAIEEAATYCKLQMDQSLLAQNNREKGLAMYHNSPHLWEAVVEFYKRYWTRPGVKDSVCFFAGFYGTFPGSGETALGLVNSGGVELLLDVLDHSHGDADLMQRTFCALSDNVQGSKGFADAIVKHNGVQRFVDAAMATHPMEHFHEGNGFGLRYEVLEDIIGMIKHDDESRTYTNAFSRAGLMDAVIEIMPDEPGDLYFQDHCCQVFNFLTNGNQEMQHKLADSGGAQSVRYAVDMKCAPNCVWPPDVKRWAGLTNESPPPSCQFTLANLENPVSWKEWNDDISHP